MDSLQETQRRLSNLIRLGTVSEVDFSTGACRVRTDTIETDFLPWLTPRASDTIEWSAPVEGEQVVVLSPEGVINGGVVLRGLYSSGYQPPASGQNLHVTRYVDGAVIRYDDASHALEAILPAGGTATVTADGGITLNGPLTVNGNTVINGTVQVSETLTAATDVVGGGKSLKGHVHGRVQSGSSLSGPPA